MDKSLKKLGVKWEFDIPSEGNSTPIQLRSYSLYQKQLSQYKLDDIRFMIGQEIGSQYLVEIAIGYLKNDILLDAAYYEGDLLNIILKLPLLFWEKHSELTLNFHHLLKN
ncbi:MAG: contact-dependent growth inhibition system immunity protein [Flavobacteriales bacterium]